MKSKDYYYASRLTSEQAGECTSWEFPSIAKRLGLERKNVLPDDFDRDRKELERHIEMSKKVGHEEGYKIGKGEGHNEGLKLLTEKAKSFDALLSGVENEVKELGGVFTKQILDLSIEIAKTIIRNELNTDPKQIEVIVKEALNYLPINVSKIKLRMHPEDISLIKDTEVAEVVNRLENISFVADEALTRGGCVLDAGASHMDATIEERLAKVLNEIKENSSEKIIN